MMLTTNLMQYDLLFLLEYIQRKFLFQTKFRQNKQLL
jgi:hypothetical protein